MQRWILERNGLVRTYLLTQDAPTDEQKRIRIWGSSALEDNLTSDLDAEGVWRLVPDNAGLVGDDWTFNGSTYAPPVR